MTDTTSPAKGRAYPWFACWNDISESSKVRTVAKRAKVPMHAALAVWVALLCKASEASPRGAVEGITDEEIAVNLDLEEAEVARVRAAMEGLLMRGTTVINWQKRQVKRPEDSSAERMARLRERRKSSDDSDGDVTQSDATRRDVTPTEQNITEHKNFVLNAQERLKAEDDPFVPREGEESIPLRGNRKRNTNAVELVFQRYPWMREAALGFCAHKGVAPPNRMKYLSFLQDIAAALDADPTKCPGDYPTFLPWNPAWGPAPMGMGVVYGQDGRPVAVPHSGAKIVKPWEAK